VRIDRLSSTSIVLYSSSANNATGRDDASGARVRNVDADGTFLAVGGEPLQIQETYITVGTNQSQVDIAKPAPGMIKQHLALLGAIQKGGMRG